MSETEQEAVGQKVAGRSARPRAGEHALGLFAAPLTLPVLRALAGGSMRLAELRKDVGLPPQTTLRGHLAGLVDTRVIARRVRPGTRYAMDYELAPLGAELLDVADGLEVWLGLSPDGPISLESNTGKGAVRALVDGWGSQMMRALASGPLSLTELDRLIADLNYPALERRLAGMRMAGLVEADRAARARTPYAVSDWGRRAMLPLAQATRCERRHLASQTEAPTGAEIEAAFLLAIPLAVLPRGSDGWCQLRVERRPGSGHLAGVRVEIEAGEIVSCVSCPDSRPRNWAAGSTRRWFEAVNQGDPTRLRFSGGNQLAASLVQAMHVGLTAAEVASARPSDIASGTESHQAQN